MERHAVKTQGSWDLGPSPGSVANKQYDFCLTNHFSNLVSTTKKLGK